ncbi:MAG TPA: hypothetical protein VKY59_18280, partial [Spirillospora sp.]|nr:hypothetical protein [Spirillospora sp.]
PLSNVKVELFDRDEHSPDDSLGVARTNKFGEATFKYTTRDFIDSPLGGDDQRLKLIGERDTVPDLYPVVYDSSGQIVITRRDEATRNNAALHLLVLIDEAVANQHGLGG